MVKMAFGVLEVAARGAIGRGLLPADAALCCARSRSGPHDNISVAGLIGGSGPSPR